MIIGQPEIFEDGQHVGIRAEISNCPADVNMPAKLWFRVAKRFGDGLAERSESLLVAMLPVAMAMGTDLEVEGTVSARLLFGLRDYQKILNTWWPKLFSVVELKCADIRSHAENAQPAGVGATFSGGVDSFYTLYRHRPAKEELAAYRLTHSLMINGFDNDVDPDDTGLFRQLESVYRPMLEAEGIELVIMHTNLQQFRLAAMAHGNLHLTFGLPLAAAALTLGKLFGRFYIPASYHYARLVPDGSHPILDYLLSTDSTQIIHDGASATRVAKTVAIAEWPAVHSRLRVCFEGAPYNAQRKVFENCCKCEKCLRTMIPLEVIGQREQFSTFAQNLSLKNIRRIRYLSTPSRTFAIENLRLALEARRWDLVVVLAYVVVRGKLLSLFLQPIFRLLPQDLRAWVKARFL